MPDVSNEKIPMESEAAVSVGSESESQSLDVTKSAVGESPSRRRPEIMARLLVWLTFSVIIGMLPLLTIGIKDTLSPTGFNMTRLLAPGELFIISATIAAAAMGELVAADVPGGEKNLRVIALFFCLLCCIGNAIAYTQVSPSTTPSAVVHLSTFLFFPSVIASGTCIGMAAGR